MVLNVAGVKFSYNSSPVLRDVSFELARGRVLAVLGVNGSGKSTLLKCINNLLKPSTGAVLVGERDILGLTRGEAARLIAYVPQRNEYGQLTVFDSVLLGRRPHIRWAATQDDYRVVEQVLFAMNLETFALRRVNELSGGEAQKVAIARALAQGPQLLLLDEPTSNLDLKNQIEVMTAVVDVVQQREISALIAVHDLNLALRFADHFLLLKDGRGHMISDRTGITAEVVERVYGVRAIVSEVEGRTVVVPVCCQ